MNDVFGVAVVGCGVAGLSAAVAAQEAGARVVVIERAPEAEYGGNTRYTEAFLRMKSITEVADDFSTHLQANSGYNVDPSLAVQTLNTEATQPGIVRTLNMLDPALIETFADAAGPTLEWLQAFGVRFTPIESPFLVKSTTRWAPSGGGLELIESLMKRFRGESGTVLFDTTAHRLLTDPDTGAVTGLRCVRRSEPLHVRAGSVVLACGGFEGNPEMLSRYVHHANYARPVARGGYYNRGEGIQMALDVGAAACGDYQLFHAEPIDPRSGIAEPALFIFPFGILVNTEGKRFVDEAQGPVDATYEAVTREVLKQPGGLSYVVLDAKIDDVPNYQVAIRTDHPPVTAGSLEELATALGLPREAFCETVASYNAACDPAGTFDPSRPDGLGVRGLAVPKSNWSRPLDRAPFTAYPLACANVFTFGGLKTTPRAEVLDTAGGVLPGLYAAGETAGIYFGTYTGSTSVLRGAVFGRIAGTQAAGRSGAGASAGTALP
jgi:tricarballylate dehydrogenase